MTPSFLRLPALTDAFKRRRELSYNRSCAELADVETRLEKLTEVIFPVVEKSFIELQQADLVGTMGVRYKMLETYGVECVALYKRRHDLRREQARYLASQ